VSKTIVRNFVQEYHQDLKQNTAVTKKAGIISTHFTEVNGYFTCQPTLSTAISLFK